MNTNDIIKDLLGLMLELNNDAKEATERAMDALNKDKSVLENDVNFQEGKAAAYMNAAAKVGKIATSLIQEVKNLKN
jgi:hypothetical protein